MMLTLKEIRPETAEVSTFVLISDTPIDYRAGQHVSIRLPHENPDSRGTIRNFSLSSSPTEEQLAITLKRGESSFKRALFALPIGAKLEARGPGGGFILREEDPGHHVMIAAGIGITPFRSMVTYASDTHLALPITVLYSNKTPEETVFKEYLDALSTKNPSITMVYTVTGTLSSSWNGRTGRIDEALIKEFSRSQCRYYVCGPLAFVESMVALLGTTMRIPSDRIHFEKFTGYN